MTTMTQWVRNDLSGVGGHPPAGPACHYQERGSIGCASPVPRANFCTEPLATGVPVGGMPPQTMISPSLSSISTHGHWPARAELAKESGRAAPHLLEPCVASSPGTTSLRRPGADPRDHIIIVRIICAYQIVVDVVRSSQRTSESRRTITHSLSHRPLPRRHPSHAWSCQWPRWLLWDRWLGKNSAR